MKKPLNVDTIYPKRRPFLLHILVNQQTCNCNYVILVSESKREPPHQFYKAIGYSTDQRGFKKRLMKAAREHGLDLTKCIVIGDVGFTDMLAGSAVGATKVLIRIGWGEGELEALTKSIFSGGN